MLGDDGALARLKEIIHENRDHMGFGVASGRSLELIDEAFEGENGVQEIDVVISSVGSEIYYGTEHVADKGWASHLRSKWRPQRVHEALDDLEFIHLQKEEYSQREFKISYDLDEKVNPDEAIAQIHDALARAQAAYSLIFLPRDVH